MRFKVKRDGKYWVVVDSSSGAILARFFGKIEAETHAQKLNQNPPPQKEPGEWSLVMAHKQDEIDGILKTGFEPFAVWDGQVYFKKQEPQGNKP